MSMKMILVAAGPGLLSDAVVAALQSNRVWFVQPFPTMDALAYALAGVTPDLVILDDSVFLPHRPLSYTELRTQIAAAVPILLLREHADHRMVGAVRFPDTVMEKPFSVADLWDSVTAMLSKQPDQPV
jgi:DNA-binding response OmpR family regulator